MRNKSCLFSEWCFPQWQITLLTVIQTFGYCLWKVFWQSAFSRWRNLYCFTKALFISKVFSVLETFSWLQNSVRGLLFLNANTHNWQKAVKLVLDQRLKVLYLKKLWGEKMGEIMTATAASNHIRARRWPTNQDNNTTVNQLAKPVIVCGRGGCLGRPLSDCFYLCLFLYLFTNNELVWVLMCRIMHSRSQPVMR